MKTRNSIDYIIFLGDYFDCFETPDNKTYFGIKETCDWLNSKMDEFGDKAIWLIGNHDLAYQASYLPKTYNIRKNTFYSCSGWTKNKASTINKYLNPKFWNQLELCCEANGYIVSHAGFHYNHFQPMSSEMENIKRLYNEWETDKHSFYHQAWHWIWNVGNCRGGIHDVGSPLWLDWNHEFVDIPDIPQIVGHTNGNVLRQKGGSYCIDVYRSTYGVLEPGNSKPNFYMVNAEQKKKKIPDCLYNLTQ